MSKVKISWPRRDKKASWPHQNKTGKTGGRSHRELMTKNRELLAEVERRKKAEQTVRKAQKQWEEIFEAIGHMALVIDEHHTIIAANRSAVKQIGMPKQKIIGAKCHDILLESQVPTPDCR